MMKTTKRLGLATALSGSLPAKQRAVVVLEVLSGECGLSEASRRLGISPTRYYALEVRALQGMLQALEPHPRRVDTAVAQREHVRLTHEVLRLQALVRATQRAVALASPPPDAKRRRVSPRGRKVIAQLRVTTAPADQSAAAKP
jgi:hypothetical protein